MNFSAVDKTVLTPQGRQEMKGVASPIKFTEALQNGDALKVNPQGGALMEALGFGPERVEENDPDFYMPDGQGKRLSDANRYFLLYARGLLVNGYVLVNSCAMFLLCCLLIMPGSSCSRW